MECTLHQIWQVDSLPIARFPEYMNRNNTFLTCAINTSEALNECVEWCGVTIDGVQVDVETDFNDLSGDNSDSIAFGSTCTALKDSILSLQSVFHREAAMHQFYLVGSKLGV